MIRQLVLFAFKRLMVQRDPLLGVKLKKPKPTPQPTFDDEQLEQILLLARPPYHALFLLLAETGLRIGEARWLSWDDVDLKKGVIHVRAKDDWRPKTGDERVVPISQKLKRLLENHPRRGRWVLTAKSTTTHPSTDRQIDERRALLALKRILAHLKFPGKLHTFRHSFISRCLTSGIEEAVV